MEKKSIFVTGSSGFIGSHLIKKIPHNIIKFEKNNKKGDLLKKEELLKIKRADVVIHLAGQIPYSHKRKTNYFDNNVLATLNILEYCIKKNVKKLIFVSSYVYGIPKHNPINEKHPVTHHNSYTKSKILAEELCKSYAKKYGLEVIILRPINVYGKSQSKGFLIISDQTFNDEILENAVVYRPQTLVVGVGLHWDTSKDTIKNGLKSSLEKFHLSSKSLARFVSIKKEKDVEGLIELGKEMDIPIEYIDREELATITTPNPSKTVQAFEGTSSVSEAAALKSSGGKLIVEKQKFPPNLTIAIARIQN